MIDDYRPPHTGSGTQLTLTPLPLIGWNGIERILEQETQPLPIRLPFDELQHVIHLDPAVLFIRLERDAADFVHPAAVDSADPETHLGVGLLSECGNVAAQPSQCGRLVGIVL